MNKDSKIKETTKDVVIGKTARSSNNPNGRPKGAVNKYALSVKERIVDMINNDFENYIHSLDKLRVSNDTNDNRAYIKSFTELIKIITPRPLNEEEKNYLNNAPSEMFSKYFNIKKDE